MILLRALLLAHLLLGATASGNARSVNLRSCDESFPLALAPPPPDGRNNRERRLVAVPRGDDESSREYYETGEYYAPLCPDGRRIDIRKLYRCNGGSCWNDEINQCTFECTWNPPTPKPTSADTQAPTLVLLIETQSPLLLSLKNLPRIYRLDPKLRAAMIRYLYLKLKNDLEGMPVSLDLLDLSYAGRLPGQPHDLPLNAKVKGPPDVSEFVLSYMQQQIEDFEEEIVASFKELDDSEEEAFKDLRVVAGTYNFDDILSGIETIEPTNPPRTNPPSNYPTPEPEAAKAVVAVQETAAMVPWWVWLILVLAILLCCILCACCYRYRRWSRSKDEKDVEQGNQFNVVMQNGRPRHRHRSFDDSFGTKKPQPRPRRPPRSDQSRRTAHTKRSPRTRQSHMPRPSRESRTPSPDYPVVAVPVTIREADCKTDASKVTGTWPAEDLDAGTAVSALPSGFDPPEEHAIVMYDPNPDARDPTFYTNRAVSPGRVEPEGDLSDASLMRNVRMDRGRNASFRSSESGPDPDEERHDDDWAQRYRRSLRSLTEPDEPAEGRYGGDGAHDSSDRLLSEPEGLSSDELSFAKKKKRPKRKSRRKRASSSRSKMSHASDVTGPSGQAGFRSPSMRWNDVEYRIDEVEEGSGYDSPSIRTRGPPGTEGGPPARTSSGISDKDGNPEDEGGHSRQRSGASEAHPQSGSSMRKERDNTLYSSVTHQSNNFERDGITSDESYQGYYD